MKNRTNPARAFAALISGCSSATAGPDRFEVEFIGRQNSNAAVRCHGAKFPCMLFLPGATALLCITDGKHGFRTRHGRSGLWAQSGATVHRSQRLAVAGRRAVRRIV